MRISERRMVMARAALRAGYVVVVLLATQLPFAPDASPWSFGDRVVRALNPAVAGRDAVDALRNVVLFAGWGVVWVLGRPVGRASPVLGGAVGTGILLSLAVEGFQLLSARRTASVLDLATNAAGALAGAGLLLAVEAAVRRRRHRPSYLGVPAFLLAGGYAAAVLLEGFAPLMRQDRIPGLWGLPWERLGIALERASAGFTAIGALDLVLFAPAGLLVVLALAERRMPARRAAGLVAAAAFPAMLGAEVLHGALSQPVLWAPPVAHALAIAAGAAACAHWLPAASRVLRGAARPLAVYALYAALLPLWVLRPFSPEPLATISRTLSVLQFVPLAAYRERMDVFTVVDVLVPVCLLAPLGALLAVWPLRRRGALSGVWPAVFAMALLEAAQVLVAGRYFDITDVLIQAAALLVGWFVARRAGFRPYGEALGSYRSTMSFSRTTRPSTSKTRR